MFSIRKPRVLVTVESEGQVSGEALRRLQEVADVEVVKSSTFSRKNIFDVFYPRQLRCSR